MQPKIVVITGPTASGKTALGVALAQRLGALQCCAIPILYTIKCQAISRPHPMPQSILNAAFFLPVSFLHAPFPLFRFQPLCNATKPMRFYAPAHAV